MICIYLNVGIVTALHLYMVIRIAVVLLRRKRVYGPVFELFEHIHTYFFLSDEARAKQGESGTYPRSHSATNLNLTANAPSRKVTFGSDGEAPSAIVLRPSNTQPSESDGP